MSVIEELLCPLHALAVYWLRLSAVGAETDPGELEAVRRWPLPLDTHLGVQNFFCCETCYSNFMIGFTRRVAYSTDILKKDTQLICSETQEGAAPSFTR